MNKVGKRILFNTIYVYGRLIITTVLSLVSTRLILEILGVNDFGLYNVVGGIVSILNIFCTAMHTTTRRFINVEMGKEGGCINKIFNVSLKIHILLAFIFFVCAELLGLFYINNYLEIGANKLNDAQFVFQISLLVACVGLINVPYQSLIIAKEKFLAISIIDVSSKVILLLLIIILLGFGSNVNNLRLYSIFVCLVTFLSFIAYFVFCKVMFSKDIQLCRYKDRRLYKEILVFNTYIAMGASSYMARSQGAVIIINKFFGTIVNGAYAIASQVESYLILFVSNLSTASSPQITNYYSRGEKQKALDLVIKINKLSIFLMLFVSFVLQMELPFLLKLWLGNVPEYVLLFSKLTLLSALIRSFGEGIPPLIQASGKIKAFQISGVIFTLIDLPISILLFSFGYPSQFIIIVFCISSTLSRIVSIFLMYKILHFNIIYFLKKSYLPVLKVIPTLLLYLFLYKTMNIDSLTEHLLGLLITLVFTLIIIFFGGLDREERHSILNFIKK